MATNGASSPELIAQVVQAVQAMQENNRATKEQAVQFLDKFQKRVGRMLHAVL